MTADFDQLMGRADPTMVIVTTADDEERAGCLVGFHSQSGIEPGFLAVWLSKANHTFRVAVFADTLAVHFPTTDDLEVATLFGTTTGDETDKFSGCAWSPGPDGVPLLEACPNRVIGRKVALLDTGSDHVCVVLEPIDSHYQGPFEPLRLSHVSHLPAGHEADERPEPTTTRTTDHGIAGGQGSA